MSSIKPNGSDPAEIATIPGPLGSYAEQFQKHLQQLGYSADSLWQYKRGVALLEEKMKAHKVAVVDLNVKIGVSLIANSKQPKTQSKYDRLIVRRYLEFLISIGAVKSPEVLEDNGVRASLRRSYEQFLRHQRGLSERTVFHSWRVADRFLTFRFGAEKGDLCKITAADIVGFLQQQNARMPLRRDKTLASHLRNFFRFLFQTGTTATNLALSIPSVAQHYGTRLPRHLSAEEVETLIQAVRTDTPSGRRNYAMVMLIARLGLRSPEVIAIQIDDIDWRSGEIIVRGKGQRHDRVPIPADVGQAIANYIRLDRVTTTRALFVTERAPHGPFKGSHILNNTLKDAFRRTGLKPPPPYVGSHILRHSLATSLLKRGAPLEEISDTLRHRSRATTMLYARLDIDGLRSIAPAWPVTGDVK